MNTTRLDDTLNTLLVTVALALLVGLNLDIGQGSVLGRSGGTAGAEFAQVPPAPAAAAPVVLAQNEAP